MRAMLLEQSELRNLLRWRAMRLQRRMPFSSDSESLAARYGREGERLFVREDFATRLDGDRIRLRYLVDDTAGSAPMSAAPPSYRTESFVHRPAVHMSLWAARLFVEVEETKLDRHAQKAIAHINIKLVE